jgi:teichoic acid transport system ATP-binding protein
LPPGSELAADAVRTGADEVYRVPNPAIRVEGLSLRFKTTRERSGGLKHTFAQMVQRTKVDRTIEALHDVSFDVATGSVYGIIGRNGAGKSTIMRAISGILAPDAGRISVYGRVTPLLSLGVGFNRELTGRENILLGGLATGLHPAEIHGHADEIMEFAGLGEAIDSPMRTYSSGMFGRLGFAIAAHLQPEILLIDEALSAGDASFKEKSLEKVVELCERDCTVVIVSHGMGIVKQLAERAVWLEKGEVRQEGPAKAVVINYLMDEGLEEEASSYVDV